MPDYTIYLGSDHRGFAKKAQLLDMLSHCHPFLKVVDLGPHELDPDDDFNDAAIAVSQAVLAKESAGEFALGILLCGSAHGVTMQANRIKGIRAINATTPASAQAGREHDHANILCLSADDLKDDELEPIIKTFCHAHPNPAERYARRVARLDQDPTPASQTPARLDQDPTPASQTPARLDQDPTPASQDSANASHDLGGI